MLADMDITCIVILRTFRRTHLPNGMYESLMQLETSHSPGNTVTLTLIMLMPQITIKETETLRLGKIMILLLITIIYHRLP